jgi:protein-S-isoprenylcysteine O-methyltransferase Ste14
VQTGPSSPVRHPGYPGSILTWVGFSLTPASGPVAAVVATLLTLTIRRQLTAEEALLLRDLAGYSDYVERTSRLLPHIW